MASAPPTAPSAKPELLYFDGPGRANLTRLAFVAGGVEFTDTRVDQSNWPDLKADSTSAPARLFGSMPCIQHGEDKLVAQSIATACYAAEQGLWKRPDVDRATDIMIACTNEDLKQCMLKCLFGDDESKAAGKAALPEAAGKFLAALERALDRSAVDGPFFYSTEPSLADLAVFDNVYSPFPGLKALGVDLSAYPKVVACAEAVASNDRIKAFVANGWKLAD